MNPLYRVVPPWARPGRRTLSTSLGWQSDKLRSDSPDRVAEPDQGPLEPTLDFGVTPATNLVELVDRWPYRGRARLSVADTVKKASGY